MFVHTEFEVSVEVLRTSVKIVIFYALGEAYLCLLKKYSVLCVDYLDKMSFHKKYGTKWYQKRSVYGTEVICHFYTVPLLQSMKISHKNNFCQLHIHRLIELQYVFCELETFRIFVACCSNQ